MKLSRVFAPETIGPTLSIPVEAMGDRPNQDPRATDARIERLVDIIEMMVTMIQNLQMQLQAQASTIERMNLVHPQGLSTSKQVVPQCFSEPALEDTEEIVYQKPLVIQRAPIIQKPREEDGLCGDRLNRSEELLKAMKAWDDQIIRQRTFPFSGLGNRPVAQTANINANPSISRNRNHTPAPQRLGNRRQFTDLGMTKNRALKVLVQAGKLKVLTPHPLPCPLPLKFRMDLFCKYHNQHGHHTENCSALRHAIQDLIDAGEIEIRSRQKSMANGHPLSHHTINLIE